MLTIDEAKLIKYEHDHPDGYSQPYIKIVESEIEREIVVAARDGYLTTTYTYPLSVQSSSIYSTINSDVLALCRSYGHDVTQDGYQLTITWSGPGIYIGLNNYNTLYATNFVIEPESVESFVDFNLNGNDIDGYNLPTIFNGAQGSILYRGASGWVSLAPSTDGHVLTTHGAGENPTWEPGGTGPGSTVQVVTGNTTLSTSNIISVGTLTSSITLTLPAAPSSGQTYTIKDSNGSLGTSNEYIVQVAGNGNNIDSAATYPMEIQYMAITVIYNGTKWMLV